VFKMPAARLADLVASAIAIAAPAHGLDPGAIATRTIEPRPGEKAYEELMTEDESTRARDVGDMLAVMPSIEPLPEVVEAYRTATPAVVGAYRSDRVAPMSPTEVRDLVASTFERDGPAT
jgi:FlaA1/EpsC-like NDP-sugar epimerase